MALTPRLWYIPYTHTHAGVTIHPPLLPPIDPDRHTALVVDWYVTAVSYVEVTALTATEAHELAGPAIAQGQTHDSARDLNAPYLAAADLQLHGFHYLPFSQAAIRIFGADVHTHYRALEGVYQFLCTAYRHRPVQSQDFPVFTASFSTAELLGAYRHHWLAHTGHPHQALAPLAHAITPQHP
ncbi:hypothetical protein ACFC0K_15995 [Streptomyces hydrogenans]|uniref:hypothetical protein n=1 Tax=Streptomyces hydrogenans TaxID=1873719 RepID=UPI0035E2A4C2